MRKKPYSNYKYAVYGGTFDPIHNAHIALAEYALNELQLDTIYFMPAYVNPFKQDKSVTDGRIRCEMIESVRQINPAFKLSSYEIDREGPSYTYDTLDHFSETIDGELYFILGFDSLVELDHWYRGTDILRNVNLITAMRPGTESEDGIKKIHNYIEKYDSVVHILDMPPMDISATTIRDRVHANESISDLVPACVEEYIREHNLYK